MKTDDGGSLNPYAGMSPQDMEKALAHDVSLREAVAEQKRQAEAAGSVKPMTAEREFKIKRAMQLRIRLGGLRELPKEIWANEDFVKATLPLVREYIQLRIELAMDALHDELGHELGMSLDLMKRSLSYGERPADADERHPVGWCGSQKFKEWVKSVDDRTARLERLLDAVLEQLVNDAKRA